MIYIVPPSYEIKVPEGTTCFEDDILTVPCIGEQKHHYALWLRCIVREIERLYGPYEYKYLLAYLKGEKPQLPQDKEYRAQVKKNVESVIERSLLGLHGLPESTAHLTGDLKSFKAFHDQMCLFTADDFRHICGQIDQGFNKAFEIQSIDALSLTDTQLLLFDDLLRNKNEHVTGVLLEALFPKGSKIDISKSVCDDILKSVRAYKDALDGSTCRVCEGEGHTTRGCPKRIQEALVKGVKVLRRKWLRQGKPKVAPFGMVWHKNYGQHMVFRRDILLDFVYAKGFVDDTEGKAHKIAGYGKIKCTDSHGNPLVLQKVYFVPDFPYNVFAAGEKLNGSLLNYHKRRRSLRDEHGNEIGQCRDGKLITIPFTAELA